MTDYEIHKKIDEYKISDAPLHIKDVAIKNLEAKLYSSQEVALKQFTESQPDLSDTQGH